METVDFIRLHLAGGGDAFYGNTRIAQIDFSSLKLNGTVKIRLENSDKFIWLSIHKVTI